MTSLLEEAKRNAGISAWRFLNVREGETVLEIGPGTGKTLVLLVRSVGPAGRTFGLDISEGMLAVAEARLRKVGLSDRVELKCGDTVSMSFPDESMDAVFIGFTLELFDTPEIPLVLKECCRVLRPMGRMCIVAMSEQGKSNLMTRLYDWAHTRFPNYVDCRPIHVQEAVETAGFMVRETRLMRMWGLPVEIVLASK